MSDTGVRTVAELLTEVREILDEPLDLTGNDSNLWSNTELTRWMNVGLRRVWAHVKKERENYFMRTVRSDATEKIKVYGRDYDPAEIRILAGRKELSLPPDFAELRVFEPVISADAGDVNGEVQFLFNQLANMGLRTRMRAIGPERGGVYECEIVFREEGPRIMIFPEPVLQSPIDVRMEYVHGPLQLTSTDSFEGSGFNQLMLDAVVNYVVYRARKKEENAASISQAQADLSDSLDVVGSAAGPRQARDDEVVDGYLEDIIG